MRRISRFGRVMLALLLLGLAPLAAAQEDAHGGAASRVWLMDLEGAIGPASSDWFRRALENADQAGAELFVLRLNTPGGLDKSMREMISAMLASPVPVAVYVAPKGARAASAGTYMLYASHIAAMAPATNLGSATPVQIGGGGDSHSPFPTPGGDADKKEDKPAEGRRPGSAMERKVINDAVAYIRGLAELRGRNADWAEKAVREAVNVTATVAAEKNVIDLVADDLDALLRALDGRTVKTDAGEQTLSLSDYRIETVEKDWRTDFLSVITDPSIAYILLMVGIYGLILEFYNPGVGVPGVLGAICLMTALYALQMLPISYVGLGLILLGVGMMAAEAFSPSFGVLGIGGAVAFIIGSVMLMDTELPGYQIAMPVIAAFGVTSVLVLSFFLQMALRARKEPVVSGSEGMIGSQAEALEDFEKEGYVRAMGEIWQARSNRPVRKGDSVTVRAVQGLKLDVETD